MSEPPKRRVLVVEDEVLIGMLVEEMLRELGCEVVALCTHLAEALRLGQSAAFDFAVLDINLNGEKSFPVADALRERGVPFLFATGYSAKILPPRHADALVLQKPFSREDLRQAIGRLGI